LKMKKEGHIKEPYYPRFLVIMRSRAAKEPQKLRGKALRKRYNGFMDPRKIDILISRMSRMSN